VQVADDAESGEAEGAAQHRERHDEPSPCDAAGQSGVAADRHGFSSVLGGRSPLALHRELCRANRTRTAGQPQGIRKNVGRDV
jgi:hypothetical protein